MANPKAILGAVAAGSLLTLVMVTAVAGYAGEVAATVTVTVTDQEHACGTPVTVSALIEDSDGSPISDQPVSWAFGAGAVEGDTILDAATTTNGSGIAETQVQLACGEAHDVTIVGTADDAEGSIVLATAGDGLPRTDTAPLVPDTSLPGIILAALAVLIGSGAILHRFATERR